MAQLSMLQPYSPDQLDEPTIYDSSMEIAPSGALCHLDKHLLPLASDRNNQSCRRSQVGQQGDRGISGAPAVTSIASKGASVLPSARCHHRCSDLCSENRDCPVPCEPSSPTDESFLSYKSDLPDGRESLSGIPEPVPISRTFSVPVS